MISKALLSSRRSILKTALLILLVTVVGGGSLPEARAQDITVTKPDGSEIVSESEDFPSRRFADPWDMSSRLDLSHGVYTNQVKDARWKNGIFTATSKGTDAYVHPMFPGYLGGLPNGRDGIINRIPTSKYNRFSLRLYSSRQTYAQMIWFYNQTWTSFGLKTFAVQPGWNIYTVDPTTGDWTGKPLGLRFDPTNHDNVTFKIDWIRLYEHANSTVEVAWSDSNPGGAVDIYLDNDTDPNNGNLGLITSQTSQETNSYAWNPAPYPHGTYYFYLQKPGQTGSYSGAVTINQVPLITVLNPDERGGRNYAAALSGGAWDMRQPDDINNISAFGEISFANGILAGTTLGSDSFFHLRVLTPIDTNKYHRLSFRYRYSGTFDYGLGTIVRYIWSPDQHNLSQYQTIKDIVVYPTWTTYYIDLKKAPLSGGNIGWNGNMTVFRFDPLETPPPRRFYLDFVRLAADDAANDRFTIKWRDTRSSPRPTRVSLYYDINSTGYNGSLIKANRQQASGVNKYTWNTSNVGAGTYRVYIVATDGISTTRRYSSGPIKIAH